ncbi:MAG: class I SAM-dependent methyltransferase [Rhizobiaceae bacterium]|nr:class I SAM-dependent methyltransferase [Rhizobiaceae bacterium]
MSLLHAILDGESLITPDLLSRQLRPVVSRNDEHRLAIAGDQLTLALGIARQRFESGSAAARVVEDLSRHLHEIRSNCDAGIWSILVAKAQQHPVREHLFQDPFTRWSFDKPRGYSGDAHLLDFIYGCEAVASSVEDSTPLGREIYAYTRNASSSVAVRERRDLLAHHVDRLHAEKGSSLEVLTIAAGHLREAERSSALAEGGISRWTAIDQDPASVEEIRRTYAETPVEPIEGSVKGILSNAYQLGHFDFAYAAGLYDYLPRAVAVKLTRKAMELLKPRGVYLFANFAQGIAVDGYMETFMNWELLLRSEAEMWDIINASVDRNMVDATVEPGENGNILYGIIRMRT